MATKQSKRCEENLGGRLNKERIEQHICIYYVCALFVWEWLATTSLKALSTASACSWTTCLSTSLFPLQQKKSC